MASYFGIEEKKDLPSRIEQLQGVPSHYWISAADFNTVLRELSRISGENRRSYADTNTNITIADNLHAYNIDIDTTSSALQVALGAVNDGFECFVSNIGNNALTITYDPNTVMVQGHDPINDSPLKVVPLANDPSKGGVQILFNKLINGKYTFKVIGALDQS